jgi:hypothetical protein
MRAAGEISSSNAAHGETSPMARSLVGAEATEGLAEATWPLPLWLQERIRRCCAPDDIRPKSLIAPACTTACTSADGRPPSWDGQTSRRLSIAPYIMIGCGRRWMIVCDRREGGQGRRVGLIQIMQNCMQSSRPATLLFARPWLLMRWPAPCHRHLDCCPSNRNFRV